MTYLTLNAVDYWGMKLEITASNNSVQIRALENSRPYTGWHINGNSVCGLFNVVVPIEAGGTVTLARATDTYDLSLSE